MSDFNLAADHIIARARELVNQAIAKRGHTKPPFLVEDYASLKGIISIVGMDLGSVDAMLVKSCDGYMIKVNRNHHLSRQNFSCAHEIGHILFSELKLEHYIHTIEYRTFNPQGLARARATAIERLCDIAAAELLMPDIIFKKYLLTFGVSVYAIERLANVFRVSVPAAARRIAEVSQEPCIALQWKIWQRAKSKGLRLAWHVGPGLNSQTDCIPLYTYVKYPSALHNAYENDNSVKCMRFFKIGTIIKRFPMESKGFGHGDTRYVISLVFPNR